jgi:hypothetical protein
VFKAFQPAASWRSSRAWGVEQVGGGHIRHALGVGLRLWGERSGYVPVQVASSFDASMYLGSIPGGIRVTPASLTGMVSTTRFTRRSGMAWIGRSVDIVSGEPNQHLPTVDVGWP